MDKEKKRLTDKIAARKHYKKNADAINEKCRKARFERNGGAVKEHRRYGKNGITMIDTETGDKFKYGSVKECSIDMSIGTSDIYKSLKDKKVVKGYLFEGEYST